MIGISIKPTIGVGDALQYSSLPENYFRATGKKLIDVSRPWFFDHNPFVDRTPYAKPAKTVEMWNFSPKQYDFPVPRKDGQVYLSNAEIWASVFGVPVSLNRPRLYQYEDFPFHQRESIVFHIDGKSHGTLPDHIIEHVLSKYRPTKKLVLVGHTDRDLGIPHIKTPTLWDLAKVISCARMFIGPDSGPSWIAACYPDIIVKKVRVKPSPDVFKAWVPLEIKNIHSHWDDRCHQIFNSSDVDVGFTSSYRKL